MNSIYPSWLSKQMLSGIRGFNVCAYLVALEGWRRGLELKWYYNPYLLSDIKGVGYNPTGKFFSLSNGKKTHFFFRSRGDEVSNEAINIASDKELTKKYLIKANVPVSEGTFFDVSDDVQSILDKARDVTYPLVIKPALGSLGKGVITNIRTEEELKHSIAYVNSEFPYDKYIIERFITGDDYRIYVMGDKVLGAFKRIAANVVGDGKRTISELIKEKNEERNLNPYLSAKPIKINRNLLEYIGREGKSLEDIPDENEVVFLQGLSNITSGGDSIDVTKKLPDNIKKVAINTIKAIPNLVHAGIDVIINEEEITVIEVNATAGITSHHFPMFGDPQNIPAGIIDYYFPDTKGVEKADDNIYYDQKKVLDLLEGKIVENIEIPKAPLGDLFAKRYVVVGNVQGVNFRKWVRKKALDNNLNGYTRNLTNGNVVVVVAGIDKEKVEAFKEICMEGPSRAQVRLVKEFVWDKQIKAGFEIRKSK
jgi:D-alanine-D-alanine ligase-like ATP-grasp enzyme/acylphosphatase